MNDKERLEHIKKKVRDLRLLGDSEGNGEVNINAIYNDMSWLIKKAENAQFRQAQAKVERYEKAIKECVERMNEGGPGTRRFIYEKLTGVMEGTQCTGK